MAELAGMTVVYGLIELLEQPQTFRSDARFDDTPVVLLALSGDPAVFFHAIEQAGHIGVAGNHALGDPTAGKAIGFGAPQDAQDVVLRGRKTARFDDDLGLLREGVGELEDGDEEVILERDGWALRHGMIIVVITTIVKRKIKTQNGDWKREKRRRVSTGADEARLRHG